MERVMEFGGNISAPNSPALPRGILRDYTRCGSRCRSSSAGFREHNTCAPIAARSPADPIGIPSVSEIASLRKVRQVHCQHRCAKRFAEPRE
jgi:hypothetical protein